YENGGAIWRLDLDSGKDERVPIAIHFDNPQTMPVVRNVADFISDFDLSPGGKRAVFSARGDLFTVPEKEGVVVNLSRTQGVREIDPVWSPDGQWIAYSSDESGEYEICVRPADGSGSPRQLTAGSHIWRYPLRWSPDGRMLLFSDKNQWLSILDVDSRKVTPVDQARRYDITDYSWSPDSRWVVYTKDGSNGQDAVWVYSLATNQVTQLTDARFADGTPVFSADGRYLFFLSNRTFNLEFSSFEFNYLYHKATRIYVAPLTRDTPPLLPPKNDVEASSAGSVQGGKEPPAKGGAKPALVVRIDPEGFNERVTALPIEAGDIGGLAAVEGGLLFQRDGDLHRFLFDERKDEVVIGGGVRGWVLGHDGKKLLYRGGKTYGVVEVKPGQKVGEGALKLADLTMRIEPLKEWTQIFADGWRIFRDWFYQKDLHGVDWPKMRERYGQLVPYLGSRADLDFLFGELVAEVNAGHTYVNSGDEVRVPRIEGGLLGADLRLDERAGRYVIAKIYRGENWREQARSPLTETGVEVHPGDYLIAIDGRELTAADNPYRLLEGTAGKRIPIRVNDRPQTAGAREYWIRPIASELKLFYLDWVESRRQLVDRLSGGRIGYIHVPDTAVEGNEELFRGMYALAGKEALIIDDRYNGGGFIPVVMAELVSR
ncbi:MAG TPA: PDZ domain-containing protein, partial [Candidatus Aminicenantes bacterium]|nr:PDZ domain-containing protein [Candidatus Aminicenantes bacterium]